MIGDGVRLANSPSNFCDDSGWNLVRAHTQEARRMSSRRDAMHGSSNQQPALGTYLWEADMLGVEACMGGCPVVDGLEP